MTKSIGRGERSRLGRTIESSLSLRNKLGWRLISLLVIREVDELVNLQEEIVFAGLLKVVGFDTIDLGKYT